MTGGKREGAGRPPLPQNKKKQGVYIKLPPDIVLWLKNQPRSQAVVIEEAVREKYGIKGGG